MYAVIRTPWCTLPLLTTQVMPQFVHVSYLWQNEIVQYGDYHDRSNDYNTT